MAERPKQVVFYPNEEAQEVLENLDKGERSEFINKAIVNYHKRRTGGPLYPLQQAYDTLKFMITPEAEAVRKALRDILWRRDDAPDSVMVKIHLADGSSVVEHFTDFDKAVMLTMERPDAVRMDVYDKEHKLIGVGTLSEDKTVAWNLTDLPIAFQ